MAKANYSSASSKYAQVRILARAALDADEKGVFVTITAEKAGGMDAAKALARSYQMQFSSLRSTQRRGRIKQSGDPNAESDYDRLTSRVVPHGDGFRFILYKPSLDESEFVIYGLSTGEPITSLSKDWRTIEPGMRKLDQHPRFGEYAEAYSMAPALRTPSMNSAVKEVEDWMAGLDQGEVTLEMLTADEARETAAMEREAHREAQDNMAKTGPVFG